MLFGYPVEATKDNWLHDCLVTMLLTVHAAVEAGEEPPAWPAIIPEAYRDAIWRRTGIKKRLNKYCAALRQLEAEDRARVLNTLIAQNEVPGLLACDHDCDAVDSLPVPIREPVKAVFGFAFDLLTELDIRDPHYRVIYDSAPHHVCPFCGCEYFDAPGAPREDLDHYIPRNFYPFAAANLLNLVPMGKRCNSSYKASQDILHNDNGERRKAYYPYDSEGVSISLEDSEPFGGDDGITPRWRIDFDPKCEESDTWDAVFHIRERYARDVLGPSFSRWLRNFGEWFRSNFGPARPSDDALVDGIRKYVNELEGMGLSGREFLRALVFKMLGRHCEQGNERLTAFVKDVVAI